MKKKAIIFLFIIILVFTGCFHSSSPYVNTPAFTSFRDIPGVTESEIKAVEELQNKYASFSYGMILSTEAFRKASDGSIGGFAALFCEWLSELFEIPFVPEIVSTSEAPSKLEKRELDFWGNIQPLDTQQENYFLTDVIAERKFITARLASSPEINKIAVPRFVYVINTPVGEIISSVLKPGSYEFVLANNFLDAYNILKSNNADAYVATSIIESNLIEFEDIIMEDFYPLLFNPASMGALRTRTELQPVISVITKALRNGANRHLLDLYKQGYRDYQINLVASKLTPEEKEYIESNPLIPVMAYTINYPLSFYNDREGQWQGIYFDLLKEVSDLTGLQFETGHKKDEPYLETRQRFEDGEFALVPELSHTPELEQYFIWSGVLIDEDHYALISRLDHPDITLNEILHEKVGLASNTGHARLFRQWFPDHRNIAEYPSIDAAFVGLKKGEVDMVMSTQRRLTYLTHYQEEIGYKANVVFNQNIETRLVAHKNYATLLGIIDKAFNIIDVGGIVHRWTNRTYDYRVKVAEARLPWLIGAVVLSFIILALVTGFFFVSRKRTVEQAVLRDSEGRVRFLLNATPLSVVLIGKDFKCIYVNDEAVRLNGLSSKKEYYDLYSQGRLVMERGGEFLRVAFKEGYWRGELLAKRPDNEAVPCEVTMIRLLYKNENVIAAYARDLREEKKMLKGILESEERIQLLLDATPLAINLVDKNYQTIFVNKEALRLFGLKNEEEYKERIFKDLSPEYQPDGVLSNEKGPGIMQKAFETGFSRHEWMHKTLDGELFPCEIRLVRFKYKDDFVLAGYARDLREEKAAIEKIRKTEEEKLTVEEANKNLQSVLEMLPVGVFIISKKDATLLYSNKKAVGIYYGRSFEEDGKDRGVLDFAPEYQPDGRKTIDLVTEALALESNVIEMQHKRLNGDIFWARVAYCSISYNGLAATLSAVEDITAELEYQRMLEEIAAREQEANQLKSRFLATMSHEIRTPMNAIIGMSELALREDVSDAKNEHIHTVKQAASNLLAIINDILDFSKIEAGKLEIVPEEYLVASLIYDLVSIIRMRVADSHIRFTVKADSRIPYALYGDETRIRQAVLNILNNAVKYTDSGFVSFNICGEYLEDDMVNLIFEVKDSGIGIKKEDIDRLFTNFTQFDYDKKRPVEGVGLGLTITKSFIDAMGGSIKVESEYGKGSTFTISLPQKFQSLQPMAAIEKPEPPNVLVFERRDIYAESLGYSIENLGAHCTVVSSGTELYKAMEMFARPESADKFDFLFISHELFLKNEDTIFRFGRDTRTVIIAEFGSNIFDKESLFNQDVRANLSLLVMPVYCTQIADIINGVSGNMSYNAVNKTDARFTAPDARVLVVDDINTNLKVAEGLLAPYNMQVDLCNSGIAAVEAVQTKRYDIVFMDHRMPGIDGVEATRRIREWEQTISNEQLAISNEKSEVSNQSNLSIDQDNKQQNCSLITAHCSLPIIALTANAVSGMMEMFIENGFNDFLSKPIDTVKLNMILEKWLPKNLQIRRGG